MRLRFVILLACLFLLVSSLSAGPIGTFQGELMDSPHSGWLFVKGRNGMLRRVLIGKARVEYAPDIPANRRQIDATSALQRGAVVRVTAEQDSSGEWRARSIVLLKLGTQQPASLEYPGARKLRHPALNSV
jgi:hypothetical protein